MTIEALIKTKTRNKVRIHRLEERVEDSVAFLSYSIDDKNKMTIWHTDVPPSLHHMGIGGKLIEEAVQLASRDSSRLCIVSPFAKEHLARHPELKERYAVRLEEASPVRDLHQSLIGTTAPILHSGVMYAKSSKVPQSSAVLKVLQIEEVSVRHPEAGEVAIDVAAVGLNRTERMYYRGNYSQKPEFPSGLGYEVVGTVTAVASQLPLAGVRPAQTHSNSQETTVA